MPPESESFLLGRLVQWGRVDGKTTYTRREEAQEGAGEAPGTTEGPRCRG